MVGAAFTYELPRDRIAQESAGRRGARTDARLLVARAGATQLRDETVRRLPDLLQRGDLLILNDSRVQPVRFFAKHGRNGREVEVLLLGSTDGIWRALCKPLRTVRADDLLELSPRLVARSLGRDGDELLLAIECSDGTSVVAAIAADGAMPLPPYIKGGRADERDRELYQTVYAAEPGSIAAPTAGLHLTRELLDALEAAGVRVRTITHHVGRASFMPIEAAMAQPPREQYRISATIWREIAAAKQERRRVVAVGTTAVRALESFALRAGDGTDEVAGADSWVETDLVIMPGFRFEIVDALMTNFHQPGTTHLSLVAGFIGTEAAQRVYEHGLAGGYRFLSYGDAMLLERQGEAEGSSD